MADSTKEAALKALLTALQTISGPSVTRNKGYAGNIPSEGLIDLRDGDPGEAVDVTLSPVTYEYNHEAEVNVVVKEHIQGDRDTEMDLLLQAVGNAIDADKTLGGTVEHAEVIDTQSITFDNEGSSTKKGETVIVLLNYTTTSPVQQEIMMVRAKGRDAILAVKFPGGTYGGKATGNYTKTPFKSWNLGPDQALIPDETLSAPGTGKDPQEPDRDVVRYQGNAVVPFDVHWIGIWLKSLLGSPTTTDNQAEGWIKFTVNPSEDDTITLNGHAITFKASPGSADETTIEADLDTTLETLESFLNAHANTDLDDATFSHATGSEYLRIVHDATGSGGNSYSLAAGAATVSASTLLGGEAKLHTFASGGTSLPDLSAEIGHTGFSTDKFFMLLGVLVNTFSFQMSRSGTPDVNLDLVAQNEEDETSSTQGGTVALLNSTLSKFNQFHGELRKDGVRFANVTSVDFSYTNNYESVETIRNDDLVEGYDDGSGACTGSINARFADSTLYNAAKNFTSLELVFEFQKTWSSRIKFTVHEAKINRSAIPINGPGGIEVPYNWVGQYNSSAGQMLTVELINDETSYQTC